MPATVRLRLRTVDIQRERIALHQLEEALLWPADERIARLQTQLAGEPDVLTIVLELLQAAESAEESMPTALAIGAAMQDTPPPERLGAYRLGPLLGHGGMGRVFKAERADGVFEQSVAIKLMRKTLLPGPVTEQFARERQILARLQHPNIARLFDGGIAPDGHSYIVMELLSGRAITEYAADHNLSLRATLELFLQVCAAVQYAHANLVVHADIKPSNVMVGADGVVKLLDFGVARALNDSKGDAKTATANNSLGMTFAYASPARQRGAAPTIADDVYSLGVLLHELLTRCREVPADMRSIVERARAEEVEQRYATADALRDDMQRWLDSRTVHAHGLGWRYVAAKFVARHRFGVASGIAAALVLIAGTIALSLLYVRAERARHQAEQRFTDLRALSRFVLFDVYDRLEGVPRALELRRDMADAGQGYLDRLSQDPRAPQAVRLEVIEGLRRLAQVQAMPGVSSLGLVPQARANLDRAEQLATTLPDDPGELPTRMLILGRIALDRATIASANDLDFQIAQRALQRSRKLADMAMQRAPNDPQVLLLDRDWSVAMAGTLLWQGKYAQSQAVAREALARLPRNLTNGPEQRAAQLQHARLLDILAEGIYYGGDPAGAEEPYRDQLKILQELSAAAPRDVSMSRRASRAGWALGVTLLEISRPKEAEPILAQASAIARQLAQLDPDDAEVARNMDIVTRAHAQALIALHRYDEALPVMQYSAEARRARAERAPDNASLIRDYAIALAGWGDALAAAGKVEQACRRYDEASATFEQMRAGGRLPDLDQDYSVKLLNESAGRYCR